MTKLKLNVPPDFLKPETRCGYEVDARMKRIWAVELDLLSELLRVCRKHGIKIFASGGTLFGAVRHKGFIPWDDDIDMMMFRSDYDRLCEVAKDEFRYPYFFQTAYTDPGFLTGHAKLKNSETMGMTTYELSHRIPGNGGIFIDIFPLDNVVDDARSLKRQRARAFRWRYLAYTAADFTSRYTMMRENHPAWDFVVKSLHPVLEKPLEKHKVSEKAFRRYEEALTMHNGLECPMVSTLGFQFDNRQHWKWRKDFETIVSLPFEFIEIPAGKEYGHALTTRYGEDWNVFKKGQALHTAVLDPDCPYTEYLKKQD